MPELARLTWPEAKHALERARLALVPIGNGHGGNVDCIRLAARTARRDHGSLVAGVMWAQLAADETAGRARSDRYGHACEMWFDEWTENGALGDPRLATAEIGEAVAEVAHRRALEFARRLAEEPLP